MGWTMVWAQAVDAVEVLRYNGRASGKGGGQVLRQLKYFQSVVRLRSCSQAIEENYLSQSAISQQMQALVAEDELCAIQAASTEPLEEADPAALSSFMPSAAPKTSRKPSSFSCTIFSDIVCVVTSFCQSLQAMSFFMHFPICAAYCTLSGQNIRLNQHKGIYRPAYG